MKIRYLNLDDYVIVYDIGKSEHSEGMTVVGRVDEIIFNEDDKNKAGIDSLGNLYHFDDSNYFDLWSNYIDDKTESVSGKNNMNRGKVKLIDSETVEFENGKQMKVIVNNGKQPTSVYWVDDTTIGFDNGSRVFIPKDYNTKFQSNDVQQRKSNDTVNHPSHYNYGDIETIDFIEQVTQHYNPNVAYHIGNAIKYLSRSPHKNGKEDIQKAKWYIERAYENWDK